MENNSPFRSSPYETRRKAETLRQRAASEWWGSPLFIAVFTLVLSALDMLVLWSIFDNAMTENVFLGIAVSFGLALSLNVLPLLSVNLFYKWHYDLMRHALPLFIGLVAVFVLLYGTTVDLRFQYKDAYLDSGSQTTLVNTVEAGADKDVAAEASDGGQEAQSRSAALVLAIMPLVTSSIAFALALLSSDPVQRQIGQLRLRRVELREQKGDLEAVLSIMVHNVDEHRQRIIRQDEALLKVARENVRGHVNALQARAAFLLAEHLGDPGATSRLTAEAVEQMEALETPGQPPALRQASL